MQVYGVLLNACFCQSVNTFLNRRVVSSSVKHFYSECMIITSNFVGTSDGNGAVTSDS